MMDVSTYPLGIGFSQPICRKGVSEQRLELKGVAVVEKKGSATEQVSRYGSRCGEDERWGGSVKRTRHDRMAESGDEKELRRIREECDCANRSRCDA